MATEIHGVQSIATGQFCTDCGIYLGKPSGRLERCRKCAETTKAAKPMTRAEALPNDVPDTARVANVTAKTRKRCLGCGKMVEVGAPAVLTDDRYTAHALQWFGRGYKRGAFHLWHPSCAADADRRAK